jgi:hypothetical protein
MARQIPEAQVFLVNGGNHPLIWSRANDFYRMAASFLEKHASQQQTALIAQSSRLRKQPSGKDLKNQFKPYGDFARLYYGARDPAHDFRHIERMVGRLSMLSDGLQGVRPHFLHFLTAFHGLWLFWNDDPKFRARAISFLQELGWGEPEIEEAAVCLERHLKDPQTVEEKVVHDANYMELLGAFGIAKAFDNAPDAAVGRTYKIKIDWDVQKQIHHIWIDNILQTVNGSTDIAMLTPVKNGINFMMYGLCYSFTIASIQEY